MDIIIIILLLALIVTFFAILLASIKIVRQSTAIVVERLGKYHKTFYTGLHLVFPIIDKIVGEPVHGKNITDKPVRKDNNDPIAPITEDFRPTSEPVRPIDSKPIAGMPISLKERVADFRPQYVITRDNVTMSIDTVVFFQVTDPKLYVYGVENPIRAIKNLTESTLRNLVGDLDLDATLTSRDTINTKMRIILDEATDPWGIKINRVELKNITPPKQLQEAMEKQMRAERERREAILRAEGEKRSKILVAEGEKEATILVAEGQKAALIAEGEGTATAARLINESAPDAAYLTLKGYEALKNLADGQTTKIIVPSEIQNVAGLLASLKGVVEEDKNKKA